MTGLILDYMPAPRGKILDRQLNVVADIAPKIVVTAKPAEAMRHPEKIEQLAQMLGTSSKKLIRAMKKQWHKSNFYVPIHVGATVQQATKIAESGTTFPGIGVESMSLRNLRESQWMPHIVGYVGVPTEAIEKEMKEAGAVFIPPYVGRDGLEQVYQEALGGSPGSTTYTVDPSRRPLRAVMSDAPKPGDSLVISIDMAVQRAAIEALAGRKGAVVALEPQTGEVLAMASTPGYDLAIFEGGLTQDESDSINQDENRPLLKRAIAGLYPPGSTFKIVTAMAAYRAGIFDPRWHVGCPGYLTVGSSRVKCENHPSATYSFNMAFTRSCNSYFGKLSQRVGVSELNKAAAEIGIGMKTGIDLPGEKSGLFPDAKYVEEKHKRPFSAGDANNVGIGQGDLLTTPLQMACVAAMVANEGVNYVPHVVKGYLSSAEGAVVRPVERRVLHRFKADPNFWATMKTAMRSVVTQGTGTRSALGNVAVGGKTGSAENSHSRKTHAWFVGFAPMENPKIAFAVVIETAGHGGSVAAPVAQQFLNVFFNRPKPQLVQNSKARASDIGLSLSPISESETPD